MSRAKQTYQYNAETGNYIRSYDSATKAANNYDVSIAKVYQAIQNNTPLCGYYWSYNHYQNIKTK
jgi:hypothetical protein